MKLLKLFLCRKSIDCACAAAVIISEGIWRSLFLATNKRWCKFKSASSCNSKHVTPAQSPEGAFFSQLLLTPELRRFFYYILSYFHHCLKWNTTMNWFNQTTLVCCESHRPKPIVDDAMPKCLHGWHFRSDGWPLRFPQTSRNKSWPQRPQGAEQDLVR